MSGFLPRDAVFDLSGRLAVDHGRVVHLGHQVRAQTGSARMLPLELKLSSESANDSGDPVPWPFSPNRVAEASPCASRAWPNVLASPSAIPIPPSDSPNG